MFTHIGGITIELFVFVVAQATLNTITVEQLAILKPQTSDSPLMVLRKVEKKETRRHANKTNRTENKHRLADRSLLYRKL